MGPSAAAALKKELDAYSNILGNLKVLVQELEPRDLGECQVTEAIRAHLLSMLDSLLASPQGPQSSRA